MIDELAVALPAAQVAWPTRFAIRYRSDRRAIVPIAAPGREGRDHLHANTEWAAKCGGAVRFTSASCSPVLPARSKEIFDAFVADGTRLLRVVRSRAPDAPGVVMKPSRGVDRELEAGSQAHYEDATYYTSVYKGRIDDVLFYVGLARRVGGPVLEYGVGNGRIALPLARHGVDVIGVDHSPAMLADLRERLSAEPADVRGRVKLRRGDMRAVRLKKRFPLVTCPFNAALHLYVREDVERFLARVREHLAPGGLFVCDLSMPSLDDLLRDPAREYRMPRFKHSTTGEVVRYVEHFDYDRARQVLFVSMDFTPQKHPERAWSTPLAHRQFFPCEWEALLHYNGFEVEKVEGDFHAGPLDRSSDAMVWYARVRRGWTRR